MARQRKKLGEILLEWGSISEQQVQQALSVASGSGRRLGEALIETGLCKEEDVANALASQFAMEYIRLAEEAMEKSRILSQKG